MKKPQRTTVDSPEQDNAFFRAVRSLLPAAEVLGADRLIVSAPTMQQLQSARTLPVGVDVISCPIRGTRQAKRSIRYGGSYQSSAFWRESRMDEARIPVVACVTRGKANLRIADYVLSCTAGHVVILPPGVPFGNIWRPHVDAALAESEDCEVLTFGSWQGATSQVNCWIIRARSRKIDFGGFEIGQISEPRVERYLEALIDEAMDDTLPGDSAGAVERLVICDGLWRVFIAALCRELKQGRITIFKTKDTPDAIAHTSHKPIARAQEYIRRNMNKTLTTDGVARAVYMSRARFTKYFRQETGQSFNEYVSKERLREAKRSLRETDWPINRIAAAVGLSPSRFRGMFQEREHTSPTAYRLAAKSGRPDTT
jgi:AraC-like DNA-binding protein